MENRAKKGGREKGHSSFERGPLRAGFPKERGSKALCAGRVGGSEDNQHRNLPGKEIRKQSRH